MFISTAKIIENSKNMKVWFERGHVDLSYDTLIIKIELIITAWWQIENQ